MKMPCVSVIDVDEFSYRVRKRRGEIHNFTLFSPAQSFLFHITQAFLETMLFANVTQLMQQRGNTQD